jgi:hypothetical protein
MEGVSIMEECMRHFVLKKNVSKYEFRNHPRAGLDMFSLVVNN